MTKTDLIKLAKGIDPRDSFANGCLAIARGHKALLLRNSQRPTEEETRRELQSIRRSAVHLEVLLCHARAIAFPTAKLCTELDALASRCGLALSRPSLKNNGRPGRGFRRVTVSTLLALYAKHDLKPQSGQFNKIAANIMTAAGDFITEKSVKTLRNRCA